MHTGLLVNNIQESGFRAFIRKERGAEVKLETLGEMVLKLELAPQNVGSAPRLGEYKTIFGVRVLRLEIPVYLVSLLILHSRSLESNV